MSPAVSNPEKPIPQPRHRQFRILAILVGLLPLIALEFVLRLAGFQPARHDPFAEFGGSVPVFVQDGDRFHTNPAREPYLAPQYFPARKGANTRRVFCFGGSTVHGRPYQVDTAFPAWLHLELARRAPEHDWEIINCGGISYASYRIVPMVREAIDHEADLVIVATGHNEFLEDRTYRAAKQRAPMLRTLDQLATVRFARERLSPRPRNAANEMSLKTRLDETSGYASYHRDDAWRRSVIEQFDTAVREMTTICQSAQIPLILVRLGANLRDCPPFKSEHRAGLSPEDEQRWQSAFEQSTISSTTSPEDALAAYREALEIDDEFALLHYRVARLLDGIDDAKARDHYLRAMNLDVCPLRMITPLSDALELAAKELGVPLIDTDTAIAARADRGIPGFDWYLDHVHPTIAGHQLIAQLLAEELAALEIIPHLKPLNPEDRRRAYAEHLRRLGPRYLANGQRRLEWLENWARREKLADETRPADADDHFRLGVRQADFGDLDSAIISFESALKLDPEETMERLMDHASQLDQQGRPLAADRLWERFNTIPTLPPKP